MAVKETAKLNTTSSKNGGIMKFFREVKSEITRISWPSKNDTKKALIAVGVVGLIYMILVGGLDYISQSLFELIFKLK
ncbi:MAG: preprotein translocase subunit SecE [Clostridium sp.]